MSSEFINSFSILTDPRIDRTKRYPLIEIVFLMVSAVISGCEGWKAIKDFGDIKLPWLRQFLPYKEGIPVDDTIARVISRLDTKEFQACFVNWIQSAVKITNGDVIAIDGKTLRRSYDSSSSKAAIHMVSAWSCANGVVLGQEKTAEKSNEITAIPELLNTLAIKGCIVTIDAMGCQKNIAGKIVKSKADYVLALKGNQGTLHKEVSVFFARYYENDFVDVEHDFYEESEKSHGRTERRQCWVIDPFLYQECFTSLSSWEKLKSIVMIKSNRDIKGKKTEEIRFYISSTKLKAKEMLRTVRQHWHIENSLHWTLDVTFREDDSRIRKGFSAENFAIARHIALNIIKRDTSIKDSVKGKLRRASLSDEYRATLIMGII